MLTNLRPAFVMLLMFTVVTGFAYPLAMTGLGQVLFPAQSNGSAVVRNGVVVGSSLIGHKVTRPDYFWARPSAAGEGNDARASSGANLGPTAQALADRIAQEAQRYGMPVREVPPDLPTASGSGLDPHISRRAAKFQAARVGHARGLPIAQLNALIVQHTEQPAIGFIGEPRVNVLKLNLTFDEAALSHTP